MGSSTTSIGVSFSMILSASSKSFSRSRAFTNLRDGGTEPCVGRPSVISTIWSGLGFMVRMARKAFTRLVPSPGVMARAAVSTPLMARGSLLLSHCPAVFSCRGFALALNPITWNWPLSGSWAVIHSTMSSERRHFCDARRIGSG
jgi:hypothetical protein